MSCYFLYFFIYCFFKCPTSGPCPQREEDVHSVPCFLRTKVMFSHSCFLPCETSQLSPGCGYCYDQLRERSCAQSLNKVSKLIRISSWYTGHKVAHLTPLSLNWPIFLKLLSASLVLVDRPGAGELCCASSWMSLCIFKPFSEIIKPLVGQYQTRVCSSSPMATLPLQQMNSAAAGAIPHIWQLVECEKHLKWFNTV